jgi:hypothetical protein
MHQEVGCGSRRYFEVEDFVEKGIRNREVEERTEWVHKCGRMLCWEHREKIRSEG